MQNGKICLTFDIGKKWRATLEHRKVTEVLLNDSHGTGLKQDVQLKEAILSKVCAKIQAPNEKIHWGVIKTKPSIAFPQAVAPSLTHPSNILQTSPNKQKPLGSKKTHRGGE